MSWTASKKLVIECLRNGNIQYEQRKSIDVKNLLATGDISAEVVSQVLSRARGDEHRESPHHFDSEVVVHVVSRKGWYIKWYFLEPDAVFISVHEEQS